MAHAQLKDLEKRITFFAEGGADILVCTTIIETGIDMPEVNTIVSVHRLGPKCAPLGSARPSD